MNSFQPGPNFGNYTGSTSSGVGFSGSAVGFGAGRPSQRGFNSMGGSGMGGLRIGGTAMEGRQGAPLFPNSGATGQFGAAPLALPSFNQLMRGSFNLPLNSTSSNLRFIYQDTLRPGGTFDNLGHPNASAMFTTSDLGNGVFLSAGTGYGIRSTAGAPAAGFGTSASGEHRPSGPSLNLKLSF